MKINKLMPKLNTCKVAILGIGYVGLPLALEISKVKKNVKTGADINRLVIGFDVNKTRIEELINNFDRTNTFSSNDLEGYDNLIFTFDTNFLKKADVFIITVPTPINDDKTPNFKYIEYASSTVGKILKSKLELLNNNLTAPIIIYESTVYPGATEEIAIPIIESESSLKCNEDFFCGYSPERINPGDKIHTLSSIKKITSGSSAEAGIWVDNFYSSIIKAGTHLAVNIKTAEAAKVIENTQRDINIALMNELSIILNKLGIDTLDVLEAASTKWNFLPFKPGLVGGHCIGVDPYYLTYKASQIGYSPQIVTAGRRINDSMAGWIVEQVINNMADKEIPISSAKVLIMGITFKEDCPDLRNSKVHDIYKILKEYNILPTVTDPLVDISEAYQIYQLNIHKKLAFKNKFDVIICAVPHKQYRNLYLNEWEKLIEKNSLIVDIKGIVPRELNPFRV
tara:strand:+ start:790 stop:2151 length:1362 start_codon:yes stop_codon:yes gene_type:complete